MMAHTTPQLDSVIFCACGQMHSVYVYDKHAHTINGQLVRCHACDLENVAFVSHRIATRDVVCRYIRRHGGSTFQVPTGHDSSDIYLRDKHGNALARVSMFDKYDTTVVSDNIPF